MTKYIPVIAAVIIASVGIYSYSAISASLSGLTAANTQVKSTALTSKATTTTTTTTTSTKGLLPLGDGKISLTGARVGYIYTCGSHYNAAGGGAQTAGPWIVGKFWDPSKKISVTGSVMRKEAVFSIVIQGVNRVLKGNGLPLFYPTGIFPVGKNDAAYSYDRNPNSISKQTVSVTIPQNPTIAAQPTCISEGTIGYTINGVAIYDGLDAMARDAVAHEVQDQCDGHPEKQGQYHYHSMSKCIKDENKTGHSSLIGYALDGFGIYGTRDINGKTVTNADLDACHGHTEKVLWNGKVTSIYHYHATAEYPYTIGCFKGTPIKSATTTQGSTKPTTTQGTTTTTTTPPAEPLQACSGKTAGAACSFKGLNGETITSTCNKLTDGNLVCGAPK